ncbi:Bax inhibitor-1 family protein [Arcobacter sp. LA11]|uniref:Bax inhibitor-1/YccA family protein n=1 Tax=Arcobacter sp. LA11 TaxID=1898176 RepID=UPI0009338CF7|nr:Bax inhibitor-1 family protein [Arcobacter sp. LA11]
MYNRDYLSQETQEHTHSNEESRVHLMSFLKATYQFFAGSMLAATAGAYIGLDIISYLVGGMQWVLFGVFIALAWFVVPAVRHTAGLNLVALFATTFLTGLMIAPLLAMTLAMPSGASIAGQAFLMTAVAFGGISLFALTTKRDFSFMRGFLFASFWIIFIAAIIFALGVSLNFFAYSSLFHLILSSGIALLMCGFILYTTQSIIQGGYDSPVVAALDLYMAFFNLFSSLLQIFGILGNDD